MPLHLMMGLLQQFLLEILQVTLAWLGYGNSNPKFTQALDFTTDFLFPLLPCNSTTAITEFQ